MAVNSMPASRPAPAPEGFYALMPLLWLKWKLTRRGVQKSTSAVFGIIILLIFFLPLAVGSAFLAGFVFTHVPQPYNEHILRVVLLGIATFWLVVPLLGYALNDSYDITKLFVYPISVRQIFVGAILGALLDFSTLLVIPTLFAILYAYTKSIVAFLIVLSAVSLFLFHILSLSQAILIASAGVLRSRRFRDIAIILAPLFWMIYYVLRYSGASRVVGQVNWRGVIQSPTWDLVSYLPPGLAARAIYHASHTELLPALLFLAALAAITTLTVYLAGWLVTLSYSGEQIGPSRRISPANSAPAHSEPASTATPASIVQFVSSPSVATVEKKGLLTPVMRAILDKEVLYMRRDPGFKVILMNLVYLMIVFVISLSRTRGAFGGGGVWWATGLLLFSEMRVFFNIFGTEGAAVPLFFAFPSPRRELLMAKNLVHFVVYGTINLLYVVVLSFVVRGADLPSLFFWILGATIIYIGLGNLMSIRFPSRVVVRGFRTGRNSSAGGIGYGFLYLGITFASAIFLLPVLAAVLVPQIWVGTLWYALTLPLAAAYAIGIYLFSLHLAVPLLLEREGEIVGKVSQSPA